MKRLLNNLYVTTDGAYLHKRGETVCINIDGETRLSLPLHTLGGIVCMGRVSCSPTLMGACGERNIMISFLNENGRFLARVQGPVSGNVLLRKEQYRRSDDERASSEVARAVVISKIANSRVVLQRSLRDAPDDQKCPPIEEAIDRLASTAAGLLDDTLPLDSIRGAEGDAAKTYFGVFDYLIKSQEEAFYFTERSRRPPRDNMNALMSFLYTLLVHDTVSALESVGLDPAVGFLHRDRPGRPSLALDIMEEFRAMIADRLALSLVNRRQIKESGFVASEAGGVLMDKATRRTVIEAYQARKREEIKHPFLGESVAVGLLPHVQAMLLARHLRGDIDAYPPFAWK
ncbi:MAG TPA: subtype I-C CRISPR-associated endonuclease Cas1 [Firmicutes bacterium]|jgi:CRISPR-associated protein Cas1|nr:subtype I-C CRISPR-associated endonuclease Cas1 [Bacillota bacterium]